MRAAIGLVILLVVARAAPAQRNIGSWATEIAAGAAADAFARGPWIASSWRRSAVARVGLAVGLSAAYEFAVEPWNGQTNAGRWQDVAQRFVGTLVLEGLCAGVWRATR